MSTRRQHLRTLAASLTYCSTATEASADNPNVVYGQTTLPSSIRSRFLDNINGLKVHMLELDEKPEPFVFLPVSQSFASESNFLVRTLGDPLGYRRVVEDAIHSIDPVLPVYGVRSLETAISASYFGQRMGGAFLGLFGAVALVLAAVGLYGVLAYTVTQRSREVGIRMALGASRSDVLRLILNQGLGLAGIGLVTGLMIALGVTRLMRSLLLDVSPTDLPTILGVSSLLALVALLASLIPALRATRIDPILSIRHD